MRQDDVADAERGTQLFNDVEKRIIIRNKNLNVITHFSQFRGRADEVWHWPWRAVPDENVEAFPPQNLSDTAPDDPEADDSYIFARSSGHVVCAWPEKRTKRASRLKVKTSISNPEVHQI
jgi:hypothetical protein